MNITYIIYSWAWPDADEVDMDYFPLELIGVAKGLENAFDIVYDDIERTIDVFSGATVEVKIDDTQGYKYYEFTIKDPDNFRWKWTVKRARVTSGI